MEFLMLTLVLFGCVAAFAYESYRRDNFSRLVLEGAGFRNVTEHEDGSATGRIYSGARALDARVRQPEAQKGTYKLELSFRSPGKGFFVLDVRTPRPALEKTDEASLSIVGVSWEVPLGDVLNALDRKARASFDAMNKMFFVSIHSVRSKDDLVVLSCTIYTSNSPVFDDRLRAQPFSDRMLSPYQSGSNAHELMGAALKALVEHLDAVRAGMAGHVDAGPEAFWRRAWRGSFGVTQRERAIAALGEYLERDALWDEVRAVGHGRDLVSLWESDPEHAREVLSKEDRAVMLDHALRHDRALFDELRGSISPEWLDELDWKHARYVLHYLMQSHTPEQLGPHVTRLARRCDDIDREALLRALGDDAERFASAGALSVAIDDSTGALSPADPGGDLTQVD